MRTKDGSAVSVRLRFADHARLGPGKMALLDAVRRTGSIAAAGQAMNMSYRRAWMLLDSVNAMFDEPVVTTAAGQPEAAVSRLTDLGHALLAAYRATEADTQAAVERNFARLLPRLRDDAGEPPHAACGSAGPGSATD
jgi:molybdate transport system regulatory protein